MFVQKKSNITFTLFTLMLLSFGWGCDSQVDEPETLPPYTEEGRNTFGCLINKELWLPDRCGLFYPTPVEGGLSSDSTFSLGAVKDCAHEGFAFVILHIDVGTIAFTDPRMLYRFVTIGGIDYTPQNGYLQIKHLDWANRIVSGVFACEFFDTDSNLVKIEEGRFDVRAKEE